MTQSLFTGKNLLTKHAAPVCSSKTSRPAVIANCCPVSPIWVFFFLPLLVLHPILNSHQHGEERCCSGAHNIFAFIPHVSPSKHIKVCISLRTHSHSLPIKRSYPGPIQVYDMHQFTVSYEHRCLQQADTRVLDGNLYEV